MYLIIVMNISVEDNPTVAYIGRGRKKVAMIFLNINLLVWDIAGAPRSLANAT